MLDEAAATFAALRRQSSCDFARKGLRPLLLVGLSGMAAIWGLGAAAQESPRLLTLEEAMRIALKQHPSLTRAEAQAAAVGARVRQAQSGMLPTLTLQGVATDGPRGAPAFGSLNNPGLNGVPPIGVQGMAGDPLKKQFGGGLNLQQTLYDFGRTQHLVASRREMALAAEADLDTQRALVLLAVQQTYLNTLRAQQLLNVQQDNLKQRETTRQQAKLLVEGDLKAGIDLQLAQANASEAGVALIAGQNEVRYAFAVLNNALGDTRLTSYRLETAETLRNASHISPTLSLDDALKRALANRPELRSVSLQRRAADQSIRSVRSELLPRLDAVASFGLVNPSPLIPNSQNYAVGLATTVPLYTGGAVEGRITEERQRREVLTAQEREAAEVVKLQVTRAWLDVQTREAQVKAAQEQVTAAVGSLQSAKERYRLQLNSLVELTEAEAIATRAQTQFVNAQYDLELARAALDWATGETYRRMLHVNEPLKEGKE